MTENPHNKNSPVQVEVGKYYAWNKGYEACRQDLLALMGPGDWHWDNIKALKKVSE